MTAGTAGIMSSRELARFFQEEFSQSTGFEARWAAERVQSVRPLDRYWSVPFNYEGQQGCFGLAWDSEFQRYLASRLGPVASQPEYLGRLLRSAVSRWAAWSSLHGGSLVRLLPSPDCSTGAQKPSSALSAALIIDSFVVELSLAETAPAPFRP